MALGAVMATTSESCQIERTERGLAEGRRIGAARCCQHKFSNGSFYAWKKKFGGMEVSDARKLRSPEDENRRIKKLVSGPEWLSDDPSPDFFVRDDVCMKMG